MYLAGKEMKMLSIAITVLTALTAPALAKGESTSGMYTPPQKLGNKTSVDD